MATSVHPGPVEASTPPAGKTPAEDRPNKRLRRRRWGWLVWLLLLGAIGFGGWRWSRSRAEAPASVTTVAVQRGSVRDFVTSVAAGRVAAKQEVTLRAEVAAKVLKLHHRRGEPVKQGEPLVTYDAADLKSRVRVAEAAVQLARAQQLQAEQAAANIETNLSRTRRLRDSGAVPVAQVDDLEGQQKALTRATESARAGVGEALANVEVARTALSKAVVLAPFAGTVLTTSVEEGETAVPGAPLLQLADMAALHVDAEIDEGDLGRIKVGMPVDVSFDAFPGERLRGTLEEIAPSVTRDLHGGRSVAIKAALPPDERLRVGMSADVDIIVAVREDALFVPPNAVQGRGAERVVYVVQDGVAHKRTISVGISTWESVEIKSGLTQGEAVVTSLSTAAVTDGARVVARAGGS
jgi:RND family efflux transporter MFP subunit